MASLRREHLELKLKAKDELALLGAKRGLPESRGKSL